MTRVVVRGLFGVVTIALLWTALLGCGSTGGGGAARVGTNSPPSTDTFKLRAGDRIKVTFLGPPNVPVAPQEIQIKNDGTIALHLLPEGVPAAGKTLNELEREIEKKYVPGIYRTLTIHVNVAEVFYYIGGEVRKPERQLWLGPTTLSRAIQSAGGFTDFAHRKKIQLTRETGGVENFDWNKVTKDPRKDPAISPGDSIYVPRRIF